MINQGIKIEVLTNTMIVMKKLRKLDINPARLMKVEELVELRGGYDETVCCWCTGPAYWGRMAASNSEECRINCALIGSLYDWKC
ncbi:MAG: hypothetical protein KK926_06415 [Methanomethylovorans sp.]|nr:hypothetical protein [Methanomethylovorans sp.]